MALAFRFLISIFFFFFLDWERNRTLIVFHSSFFITGLVGFVFFNCFNG